MRWFSWMELACAGTCNNVSKHTGHGMLYLMTLIHFIFWFRKFTVNESQVNHHDIQHFWVELKPCFTFDLEKDQNERHPWQHPAKTWVIGSHPRIAGPPSQWRTVCTTSQQRGDHIEEFCRRTRNIRSIKENLAQCEFGHVSGLWATSSLMNDSPRDLLTSVEKHNNDVP